MFLPYIGLTYARPGVTGGHQFPSFCGMGWYVKKSPYLSTGNPALITSFIHDAQRNASPPSVFLSLDSGCPGCRSPPSSFWFPSVLKLKSKMEESQWKKSTFGTTTHPFIHPTALLTFPTKLPPYYRDLTDTKLLIGCGHTGIECAIPDLMESPE